MSDLKRFFVGFALALIAAGCDLSEGVDVPMTGTEWSIDTVAGEQNLTVSPTLQFGETGQFSGFAGCNRVMGSYEHSGAALRFGAIAATKMLCEDARMQLERAIFTALGQVSRSEVDSPSLRLLAGDIVLISARR